VILQAATRILPPHGPAVLIAALVVFAVYMVYEVLRWFAGNRAQLTGGQFRRRIGTGFLLEADLMLWLLADVLLAGRTAAEKLLYLLFALLFLILPMILAVREAAFIARQYARWRSDVVRNLGDRTDPGAPP
jgi:hypothetical protein